jgi:hypothetical protein
MVPRCVISTAVLSQKTDAISCPEDIYMFIV